MISLDRYTHAVAYELRFFHIMGGQDNRSLLFFAAFFDIIQVRARVCGSRPSVGSSRKAPQVYAEGRAPVPAGGAFHLISTGYIATAPLEVNKLQHFRYSFFPLAQAHHRGGHEVQIFMAGKNRIQSRILKNHQQQRSFFYQTRNRDRWMLDCRGQQTPIFEIKASFLNISFPPIFAHPAGKTSFFSPAGSRSNRKTAEFHHALQNRCKRFFIKVLDRWNHLL